VQESGNASVASIIEMCANVALSVYQACLNEDIECYDASSDDSKNGVDNVDIGKVDEEIDQPLSPDDVNYFDGALSDDDDLIRNISVMPM
jgi:hypothetical protein